MVAEHYTIFLCYTVRDKVARVVQYKYRYRNSD